MGRTRCSGKTCLSTAICDANLFALSMGSNFTIGAFGFAATAAAIVLEAIARFTILIGVGLINSKEIGRESRGERIVVVSH